MNGRVYDPLLARFGTPDPMTESPFSTQGWNRYAYVGNSPLNFTDPTGYCFLGCFWKPIFKAIGNFFKQAWGSIVQFAAAAICAPAGLGPVCAAVAATFVTGVTSGDLGLALKAGLIAGLTVWASQGVGDITKHGTLGFLSETHVANIAGHAAVGCASAAASGGKCGAGALSGAAGSFAGPLLAGLNTGAKLVATSVVGGVASVAGGGKFANGAVTAAFGYVLNEVGLACSSAMHTRYLHWGLFVYTKGDEGSISLQAQFSFTSDAIAFNQGPSWLNQGDLEAFWTGVLGGGAAGSGVEFHPVFAPEEMSQQQFDDLVIYHAERYWVPKGVYRTFAGPNSNSAAGYPIITSGGTLPNVPNAPALGYYLTNPYPASPPPSQGPMP